MKGTEERINSLKIGQLQLTQSEKRESKQKCTMSRA